MAFPTDAIVNDFWIHQWALPIYAHPSVALSFRVPYYEKENRGVAWTLTNAPSGMAISADGTISWATPVNGTYAGIVITARRGTWDSVNYPSSGLTTTATFTCTVDATKFLFVATAGGGGNNANPGTLASPKLTIANALTTAGATGKCIMVRAGAYGETFAAQIGGGNNYTAAAYMEIVNYPGESVTVTMTNYGFEVETSQYILFKGLDVTGCTHLEGGQISLKSSHGAALECICHGSAWDSDSNTTGMLLNGDDNVFFRCVSYQNTAATGNANNRSNYLIYNDVTGGTKWMIGCKGRPTSTFDVKIKHTNADNSRFILHDHESVNLGVIGYGKNSSFRYCVVYRSATVMELAWTDPSAYTTQGMLIEHNTLIGTASSNQCLTIAQDYGGAGSPGYGGSATVAINRNICFQSNGASVTDTNDNKKMFQHWHYTSPLVTARGYPYTADYNCYYNTTNFNGAWLWGSNGVSPTTLNSLAQVQAITGTSDPNSIAVNPLFTNEATGNLNITGSSPCASVGGDYIGAFSPNVTYGTVGQTNNTLLEWAGPDPGPAGSGRLLLLRAG